MINEEITLYFKCTFVSIFIVIAVIGNSSVIYAIKRYKKLQTIPNIFVLNLAITDLSFSLTGLPMILVTGIARHWVFGYVVCQICGLLTSLLCTTSIMTLLMISVHRYIAVARPTQLKKIYTIKRTGLVIAGVWMFSTLISVPPLFGWSRFVEGTNMCLIDGKKNMSYSVFLALVIYFAPLLVLSCLYLRIFFILRRHTNSIKRKMVTNTPQQPIAISSPDNSDTYPFGNSFSSSFPMRSKNHSKKRKTQQEQKNTERENVYREMETVEDQCNNTLTVPRNNSTFTQQKLEEISLVSITPTNSPLSARKPLRNSERLYSAIYSNNNGDKSSQKRKRFFREVKVTKMLLIVICGFFICWTPFVVASILFSFGANPTDFELMTFSIMVACLNSVINPIIYAVMNSNFRFAFRSMTISVKMFFHKLF